MTYLKNKLGSKVAIQTEIPLTNQEGKLILGPVGIIKVNVKNLHTRKTLEYNLK